LPLPVASREKPPVNPVRKKSPTSVSPRAASSIRSTVFQADLPASNGVNPVRKSATGRSNPRYLISNRVKLDHSSGQPSPAGGERPCRSPDKADVLTVFFTGNELGALKPCGCSGGQLGGLDRRLAIFNTIPKQKRLVVDTGMLVETDSEQNLLKFNIILEALRLLDYDLVNLAKEDIDIGKNLGLLDSIVSDFNVVSSYSSRCAAADRPADVNLPTKFAKKFCLEKESVAVTVAAFDTKSRPIELIYQLFPPSGRLGLQSLNILILNTSDAATIDNISKIGIIDCFIVPADSDEPRIIGDPNSSPLGVHRTATGKSPLVFSVGRFGRYISKLQIGITEGNLKYSFSAISVTENLPQEKPLVELYQAYQQLVAGANLLEKYPRFILPGGLEYAGSQSCKPCHEYEYEKWSQRPHAHAYATLERVGSQFDPECAICHVVGMKYESGFVSEQETIHLKNVGCENCHGPGSEHNTTLGKAKTTEPKSTCLDCHTPETSSEYAGNEQLYLEKIIHWKEPNTPSNVK